MSKFLHLVHEHIDRISAWVFYMEIERRMTKTKHGSVLGWIASGFVSSFELAQKIVCVTLRVFKTIRKSEPAIGTIPVGEMKEKLK